MAGEKTREVSLPSLPVKPPATTPKKPEINKPISGEVAMPTPGEVRHFEFIKGSSQRFWEISLSGNSFKVRFGRIGTAGQTQTKTFADAAIVEREAENLITEKVKKGYVERKSR